MGENGWKSEGSADSLSATGMFLRDFDSPGKEPQQEQQPEAIPAAPLAKVEAAPVGKVEEGEFTRLFHPLVQPQTASATPLPTAIEPAAQQPAATRVGTTRAGTGGAGETAGEFTRIFVLQPPAIPQEPLPVPQTPPASVKAKGFSSPGVSDSASAAGSFTQMFHPLPPSSTQTQAAEAIARELATPPPASPPAPSWPVMAMAPQTAQQAETTLKPAGVTELLKVFSGEQREHSEDRKQREEREYRAASIPQPYREPVQKILPEDHASNFIPSSSGVTALLSRLTDENPIYSGASTLPHKEAAILQDQPFATAVAPSAPAAPITPVPPGEFTRLIDLGKAQPTVPPQQNPQAAPQPPAGTSNALAAAPLPPIPGPIPVPAAPSLKPPTLAAPAAPQASGMASKLREMLPLLLVANAFLMIILIVVVLFALHAR